MLQRIYAVAFPKKEELDQYLAEQAEALKRDHNKLGRELEYFTTVDCIGQGLPILLPKGARVIQLLQRWVEAVEQAHGYLLTKTPLMAKRELYKISAARITILTACSSSATRGMRRRSASPCAR